MKELTGHTTPDTAYLVPDYPYGLRLRTEIRYWIETKKGQGQRTMSQTRDPKRAGMPWNKPKGSTYSAVRVLLLNPDTGHVEHDGLSPYGTDETVIRAFIAKYPETSADERNRGQIRYLIAVARAYAKHVTYRIVGPDEPRPDPQQRQAEIIQRAISIEYAALKGEG